MNNRSNHNRYRKPQRTKAVSYIWAGIMSICALAALFAAIWVVITVYEKIAGDSSEWVLETSSDRPSESQEETKEAYGWITDENGSRYREDDGTFALDTWKIWQNKLYYLNEDGLMATENVNKDGQIFYFESSGALIDIQPDPLWTGLSHEDNLQNLDSLVKGYEFWGYLSSDTNYTGAFKPICYRKTTETKEEFLGSKNNPELSTKHSLQIHDGYIYYLPQVSSQSFNRLSENEKNLCNKLFRMKPGENQKELLAENATGYLVLSDGSVYYASSGAIHPVGSGTMYLAGEDQYRVEVKEDGCYLLDSMGNPVTGNTNGIQILGNREYHLNNGRITNVYPAEQIFGNVVFTLEDDTENSGKKAIYKQENGGQKLKVAQAPLGIDCFCIAEDYLYYSAFMEQGIDGTRYSAIYRLRPDGIQSEKISTQFKGNLLNLYYYDGKQKIYGEYAPNSWRSCYGQIVMIDFDGSVTLIDDSSFRGNSDMSKNELLSLVMINGTNMITYLRNCEYRSDTRTWNILSEKPYQFADTIQLKIAESILNGHVDGSLEENPESASESSEGEESQEENNQGTNRNDETTQQSHERPTNQETEGQHPSNRETQSQRPGNQETQNQRPGNRETQSQQNQGSQPSNQKPGQSSQPAPALPDRPAEPGYAPTSPTQESPDPGNQSTIPTIEANPESTTNAMPANPEESVWYIGPNGRN